MKIRVLIGVLLIAAIAGTVAWRYVVSTESQSEGEFVLYGNVDIREARLAFNGNEHVSEILVQEGDRVKAGQPVARLHTDRLTATLDRARAEVAAAEAEAHAAHLGYQRVKSMASRNLASSSEADEAEAKSRAAQARVTARKAVMAETAQTLKDATLYAPFAGVVRERIVEVGDFVTPQSPVITLALLNPVWVRTYLPESYLGRIKPGAKARVHTDSYPDKTYEAWVGSISPTAEFTPKNIETPELRTRLVYQMRVYVCNPQFELRLGMPATVTINPEQKLSSDSSSAQQAEQRCSPAQSAAQ